MPGYSGRCDARGTSCPAWRSISLRTSAGEAAGRVLNSSLGLLYRVMVLGGGRRSEVCGFRWDGADLEVPYTDPETGEPRLGAVLPVKRVLIQLGGKLHEEATAKTKTGDRLGELGRRES